MYTETLHPFFQDFCHEIQLLELEDLCHSHKSHSVMSSSISEYDMGGEGDLFKAPEPIIEEQVLSFDPILDAMTAAASMVTCVDDVVPTQGLSLGDGNSIEDGQFLDELLFEHKKDLLGSISADHQMIEILDIKLPATSTNEIQTDEKNLIAESVVQKSVSSGCLSSIEWVSGNLLKPNFLDFSELDFEAAYGMRRAFSEGDIKALGNGNINLIHSQAQRPPVIFSCTPEDRQQKLCRYREKKSRRNFGRKIKYACRKALADSQPRIRGRFAKTEETDHLKRPTK
ncbi:hypothetical protein V2J09_001855 [Rumex salicifolius]